MSTVAYASITRTRELAAAGITNTPPPPGVRTWVDAMAALVPAEVLTAHALLLSVTTQTANDAAGKAVTTITDPVTLNAIFYALIALSIALYIGARLVARAWDQLDYARMLIPPVAFVAWTMLQRTTAFDAAFPTVATAPRTAVAVIGAIALGAVASALAGKVEKKLQ